MTSTDNHATFEAMTFGPGLSADDLYLSRTEAKAEKVDLLADRTCGTWRS
jgi:hypothetical protein